MLLLTNPMSRNGLKLEEHFGILANQMIRWDTLLFLANEIDPPNCIEIERWVHTLRSRALTLETARSDRWRKDLQRVSTQRLV